VEEGIVPGGGAALLRCLKTVDTLMTTLTGDRKIGAGIIRRAITEPLRVLADNAGVEGSVIVEKVKHEKKTVGYDVDKEEYVDMFKAGIIDPTKVTRSALQNAASIAALFLTTEAVIAEKPEKEKAPAMPGGGDMDF
jgi:chaperonin GroEL